MSCAATVVLAAAARRRCTQTTIANERLSQRSTTPRRTQVQSPATRSQDGNFKMIGKCSTGEALLWRVASNDDAAPDIRSAPYRYYICRLSVVLKASAYTLYKRYLTKCVDSPKLPAVGE
jgi:hypothetical protein